MNHKSVNDDILNFHIKRKTFKEKTRFINFLANYFNNKTLFKVDKNKGVFTSRNIIFGNIEKANIIFTAHYDTPAISPIPNIMFSNNIILFLLYQTLILIPFSIFVFCAAVLFKIVFNSFN